MPVNKHEPTPAPALPFVRAGGGDPHRGLRRGPDVSRYASLAEYPPCECGAAVCPDTPPPPEPPESAGPTKSPEAATGGAERSDDIRARVRETNAMRAKYRL